MAEHNITGKKGEDVAQHYLTQNGYKIRNLNWRFRKNELDIIAEKDNCLVVVEVKTRTSEYFESPKETVTRKKQKFIIAATQAYIEEFNINMEVQFDIVGVSFLNFETKIEHIQDAFQPSLLL
jgi:putative endonuclease